MSGIVDLELLLKSLSPEIHPGEYVFCTVDSSLSDVARYCPIAIFQEQEGLALVLSKQMAQQNKLSFDGVFKQITLNVHSSLHAVGLTAAVANQLAKKGISANVVAAFHHDHIFVPSAKGDIALAALLELAENAGGEFRGLPPEEFPG